MGRVKAASYEQHFFEEGKIYCVQTETKSEIYLQNIFVER